MGRIATVGEKAGAGNQTRFGTCQVDNEASNLINVSVAFQRFVLEVTRRANGQRLVLVLSTGGKGRNSPNTRRFWTSPLPTLLNLQETSLFSKKLGSVGRVGGMGDDGLFRQLRNLPTRCCRRSVGRAPNRKWARPGPDSPTFTHFRRQTRIIAPEHISPRTVDCTQCYRSVGSKLLPGLIERDAYLSHHLPVPLPSQCR